MPVSYIHLIVFSPPSAKFASHEYPYSRYRVGGKKLFAPQRMALYIPDVYKRQHVCPTKPEKRALEMVSQESQIDQQAAFNYAVDNLSLIHILTGRK